MSIDWEPWKFLLGEWEGDNTGDPGQGTGSFIFSFDLDENVLVRRSHTVFPATPERDGYTHDDLIIIYTEYTGEKRAIYFDNEQHVIHYATRVAPDGRTITLESDPIPSLPQFRFSYLKTGRDSVLARFEMTPPGKPGAFFTYLEGSSRRIKPR
jgi:hypothetical protein